MKKKDVKTFTFPNLIIVTKKDSPEGLVDDTLIPLKVEISKNQPLYDYYLKEKNNPRKGLSEKELQTEVLEIGNKENEILNDILFEEQKFIRQYQTNNVAKENLLIKEQNLTLNQVLKKDVINFGKTDIECSKDNLVKFKNVFHESYTTFMKNSTPTQKSQLLYKLLQQSSSNNISKTLEVKNAILANALMKENFDVNYKFKEQESFIQLAVKLKNLELIKLIITNIDFDYTIDKTGTNILEYYLKNNDYFENFKLLVSLGADTTRYDKDGEAIIHKAIKQGNSEAVRILADKDANLLTNDGAKVSPIWLATIFENLPIFKILIEKHANVNFKYKVTKNTLLHMASKLKSQQIMEHIIDNKLIPLNETNEYEQTALHSVVINGDYSKLSFILEKGFNVNAKDNEGNTPLHLAIKQKNLLLASLLAENGADVNAPNKKGVIPTKMMEEYRAVIKSFERYVYSETEKLKAVDILYYKKKFENKLGKGYTLLHLAAQENWIEIVKELIRYIKDVDVFTFGKASTPLSLAVTYNHFEIAEYLINNGANVNQKISGGNHPLLEQAVYKGYNMVQLLLKNGANVNATDNYEWSALHRAAERGNNDVFKLLISYGANIQHLYESNGLKYSLLYWAAQGGNIEIVKFLVENGLDVNYGFDTKNPAILASINSGKLEVAAYLIEKGAQLNIILHNGMNIVNFAAYQSSITDAQFVKILLEKYMSLYGKNIIKDVDSSGNSLLHLAVERNNKDLVEYLLQQGLAINTKNNNGSTPLHNVTDPSIADILIKHGADIHAVDKNNKTPLMNPWRLDLIKYFSSLSYSVKEKSTALISIAHSATDLEPLSCLISKGASVNARDNLGNTPLSEAVRSYHKMLEKVKFLVEKGANVNAETSCYYPNVLWNVIHFTHPGIFEVVEYLINQGVNIHATDKEYRTVLNDVIKQSRCYDDRYDAIKILKLLVQKGISVNAVDNHGWTPLHHLFSGASSNTYEVARILIENGADPNAKYKTYLETPLHYAVQHDQLESVKFMLERGAEIDAKNSEGITPLWYACGTNGSSKIVDLLIKSGASINVRDNSRGFTILHQAAQHGQVEKLKIILDHLQVKQIETLFFGRPTNTLILDTDVIAKGCGEYTPLILAASNNHVKAMKILIDNHADVNKQLSNGTTVIYNTISWNKFEATKLLLIYNADLNIKRTNGDTAFKTAFTNNNKYIINLILIYKSLSSEKLEDIPDQDIKDLKVKLRNGKTLLQECLEKGDLETLKLLLDYGADIEEPNSSGLSLIHIATVNGNLDALKITAEKMIFLKMDINYPTKDNNKVNALWLAAKEGQVDCLKYLLSIGSNLDIKSEHDKSSALFESLKSRKFLAAELLLDKKIINTVDSTGKTPLHYACTKGYTKIVKLLLANGADIEITNYKDHNNNAFHYAASFNQLNCFKILTKYKKDIVDKSNSELHTPLFLAVFNNAKLIVEYLLNNNFNCKPIIGDNELGIIDTILHAAANIGKKDLIEFIVSKEILPINTLNSMKQNILHLAIKNNKHKLTKYLVEKDININAQDIYGNSPLHYAAQVKSLDLITLLLQHKANAKTLNNEGEDFTLLSYDKQFEMLCTSISSAFITMEERQASTHDSINYEQTTLGNDPIFDFSL